MALPVPPMHFGYQCHGLVGVSVVWEKHLQLLLAMYCCWAVCLVTKV